MWIDLKYANLLSNRLERFSRKGERLFNFRCPFCGDSRQNKYKARGYVYTVKGRLNFKCHNCGHGTTLMGLVEHIDPFMAKQYKLELFKEGHSNTAPVIEEQIPDFLFKRPKKSKKNILDENFITVEKLAPDHEVRAYCTSRKIPEDKIKELYYIPNVQKLEDIFPEYQDRIIGEESRLGIPFYDHKGNVVALSCRAIDDNRLRYLTIKVKEEYPLIYNLPNVDQGLPVYVTEGPLDSLFLPNAIAVGGTDLKRIEKYFDISNVTFVFDNQPRNKELVKIIENLGAKASVVVWPDSVKEKDINEMIINGKTPQQVLDIIQSNTYSDLSLKLALSKWRKV